MSEPFIQTSTPAIDRANRLISLRANPGFQEAWRISKDLVDTATQILISYPGWDPQQIMVLKARAQAAQEHHDMFFAKITEAIREGVAEQAAQINLPEKPISEIIETGDYVRQQVLTKFDEMDAENRPAGSY